MLEESVLYSTNVYGHRTFIRVFYRMNFIIKAHNNMLCNNKNYHTVTKYNLRYKDSV